MAILPILKAFSVALLAIFVAFEENNDHPCKKFNMHLSEIKIWKSRNIWKSDFYLTLDREDTAVSKNS